MKKVMKFGGTSVKTAERIQEVISIVRSQVEAGHDVFLVVSAMKGTTEALIDIAETASTGDEQYLRTWEESKARHISAVHQLCGTDARDLEDAIERYFEELREIAHGMALVRECTARTKDLVMSFGERLNARIIATALNVAGVNARYQDSRKLIVTDDQFGKAEVDFAASEQNCQRQLKESGVVYVLPGFVASTENGITSTLGRNGSDYTAAIIGASLGVDVVEIWTDVSGVLSADPRVVKNAFVIPEVTYDEAMELSFFGANVIHPLTIVPAVRANIPLVIKNTFAPDHPGTRIAGDGEHPYDITGLAATSAAVLLNVEGGGLLSGRGIAARVFNLLHDSGVHILLANQASSEHSMCVALTEADADRVMPLLEEHLADEIKAGRVSRLEVTRDVSICSVIGSRMRGKPGVSGRLFSALGTTEVNVLAIAQGSSEINISFAIYRAELEGALDELHRVFFESSGGGA